MWLTGKLLVTVSTLPLPNPGKVKSKEAAQMLTLHLLPPQGVGSMNASPPKGAVHIFEPKPEEMDITTGRGRLSGT